MSAHSAENPVSLEAVVSSLPSGVRQVRESNLAASIGLLTDLREIVGGSFREVDGATYLRIAFGAELLAAEDGLPRRELELIEGLSGQRGEPVLIVTDHPDGWPRLRYAWVEADEPTFYTGPSDRFPGYMAAMKLDLGPSETVSLQFPDELGSAQKPGTFMVSLHEPSANDLLEVLRLDHAAPKVLIGDHIDQYVARQAKEEPYPNRWPVAIITLQAGLRERGPRLPTK